MTADENLDLGGSDPGVCAVLPPKHAHRVDAVIIYSTCRKPFDMIFERGKNTEWWAWTDLNSRPHPYQGCALAT